MADKVWRLTVFLADGREMTVALYEDEGEALTDALLLAEDERVLGYRISLSNEVLIECKNTV